jgi:hypothetical protein
VNLPLDLSLDLVPQLFDLEFAQLAVGSSECNPIRQALLPFRDRRTAIDIEETRSGEKETSAAGDGLPDVFGRHVLIDDDREILIDRL